MKKTILTKVAPLSMAAVAAMGFAASAQAISFKVSGQVDRAIVGADNGDKTGVGFVDNTGSNTRVRFVGTQTMANGWTVGVDNEDAFRRNRSSAWDIRHSGNGSQNVDIRQAKIWVHGPFGKLSLGQGDGAANATTEVDLSGTGYLGGGVGTTFYMGGVTIVNDNKQPVTQVSHIYGHFDALSRLNRLRYDSPNFGPFKIAVSADENQAFEGALDFASSGSWGKAAAQFGFTNTGNFKAGTNYYDNLASYASNREHIFTASASYLANNGLNITGSYSKVDYVDGNKPNPTNYFVGVGYRFSKNNFQVGYGETKDLLAAGSKAAAYNVSYVYDWTKSIQAYASYHLVDVKSLGDGVSVSAKNVNAIFMGMRVKFM